ncbi:hypothetical protein RI129_002143 [Pyrocoelia pectoralis]|uniref:GIY-YIG domain-containing protein n=1 Tax=Pyrocoelia pectoralis TaxID=417401 RepID=A0AAN7VLC6_9COLE
MGSPISSLLANVYIDHLETKITCLPEYSQVALWVRYVDDILCLWTGTQQQLLDFFDKINNLSNIKFTMETEQNNSLNYLDLTLTRDNNTIQYNIYRKPTTTDVIIPYQSHHAPQIKNASFNFMFNRLLSTPLSTKNFNRELDIIYQIGTNNNYPVEYIKYIYKKTKNRITLKQVYPHLTTPNKYIAIPYHPYIYNSLSKNLNSYNIRVTASSHPTVANLLINTKPPQPKFKKSGIYEINYNDCNRFYIGLTTRNLETRFNEHQKNRPNSAIGTHITETQHTISLNNTRLLHHSDNYKKLTILEHYEIERAKNNSKKQLVNEITQFQEPHIYKMLPPDLTTYQR